MPPVTPSFWFGSMLDGHDGRFDEVQNKKKDGNMSDYLFRPAFKASAWFATAVFLNGGGVLVK